MELLINLLMFFCIYNAVSSIIEWCRVYVAMRRFTQVLMMVYGDKGISKIRVSLINPYDATIVCTDDNTAEIVARELDIIREIVRSD